MEEANWGRGAARRLKRWSITSRRDVRLLALGAWLVTHAWGAAINYQAEPVDFPSPGFIPQAMNGRGLVVGRQNLSADPDVETAGFVLEPGIGGTNRITVHRPERGGTAKAALGFYSVNDAGQAVAVSRGVRDRVTGKAVVDEVSVWEKGVLTPWINTIELETLDPERPGILPFEVRPSLSNSVSVAGLSSALIDPQGRVYVNASVCFRSMFNNLYRIPGDGLVFCIDGCTPDPSWWPIFQCDTTTNRLGVVGPDPYALFGPRSFQSLSPKDGNGYPEGGTLWSMTSGGRLRVHEKAPDGPVYWYENGARAGEVSPPDAAALGLPANYGLTLRQQLPMNDRDQVLVSSPDQKEWRIYYPQPAFGLPAGLHTVVKVTDPKELVDGVLFNNSGQVVYHVQSNNILVRAELWSAGSTQRLDAGATDATPRLTAAVLLNDAGEIFGGYQRLLPKPGGGTTTVSGYAYFRPGLVTRLDLSTNRASPGDAFVVRATVENRLNQTVSNLGLDPALSWSGTGGVRLVQGPLPAVVPSLAAGGVAEFSWTMAATNSGAVLFTAVASGQASGQAVSSLPATSPGLRIGPAADWVARSAEEPETAVRGIGQYQVVPFNDQNLRLQVGPEGAARYVARLKNDTSKAQAFRVRAITNALPAWTVRVTLNGTDITSLLTAAGGWTTPVLAQGQSVELQVSLKPSAQAGLRDHKTLLLQAFEMPAGQDVLDSLVLEAHLVDVPVEITLHHVTGEAITEFSLQEGLKDADAPLELVARPEILTRQPRLTGGLVADGVTPLLIKLRADPARLEQFPEGKTFDLEGLIRSGGTLEGGDFPAHLRLLKQGRWQVSSNLVLSATSPETFLQVVPLKADSIRLDRRSYELRAYVAVVDGKTGDAAGEARFGLRKPPLFLTHGYNTKGEWGPDALGELAEGREPERFLQVVRYGQENPAGAGWLSQKVGSDKVNTLYSLADLAPRLLLAFTEARHRIDGEWAFVRHDVAAHSQGGLLTRMLCSQNANAWVNEPYRNRDNFYRGRFHRVVTLGSPHNGTRLLRYLLTLQNSFTDRGISLNLADLLPVGVGTLMVNSAIAQEKFDPFGPQIRALNDPSPSSPWAPDPAARFHLVRTTINQGRPPSFTSGTPSDLALGLLNDAQPVIPSGSDGVVDWDSMGGHGPDRATPAHVFTLPPEWLVSHSGPLPLFASATAQTDSFDVGAHIRDALDQAPALDPSHRRFAAFELPPLLADSIRIAIDAWARNVDVAALQTQPKSVPGVGVQGSGTTIEVQFSLPSPGTLTALPGWSVAVYGPDGVTTSGVTLEPVPGQLGQAWVHIDDAVVGDVVVRASLRGENGVFYAAPPLRVFRREPPGAAPVALALEFTEIALPVNAFVPIQLGLEYPNGGRRVAFPLASEVRVTSSRPDVVDVSTPLRWRIRGVGTAEVTLTYAGLTRQASVTGFSESRPEPPSLRMEPRPAQRLLLEWAAELGASIESSRTLEPGDWTLYPDPGALNGTRRELLVPMTADRRFFRVATRIPPAPDPAASSMERVHQETGVAAAREFYGVAGRGVLVAILDRGIDWKNADFRRADGKTRIRYIYDLTDPTGAADPGNPYQKGTIFSEAQINAALSGGAALPTRDAVGHGTTTAGIAAGGGRNDPRFRGIAPEADLLVIKVTSEGAPAHDGEPAEAAFNQPGLFPLAIDFARDKAVELGLPCVMLLNLGSVIGPTDGTSELCRKIDATVGPGLPGLAFVTGSSDDGGAANRASGSVPPGGTTAIWFHKGLGGSMDFDLWYPGADEFSARIVTPAGSYGPFAAPLGDGYDLQTPSPLTYYQLTPTRLFYGAQNGKRELWMRITGPVGDYALELTGTRITSGQFDAILNPSRFTLGAAGGNYFVSHVAPGSIWDGASAFHAVVPNSYVIQTNYTDVDGVPRAIAGEGTVGERWRGSGVGPTLDGRFGVDVSAPGDSLFTTYNPKSYWATGRHNLVPSVQGLHGRASAVSAANPIVTGIIALLLERNPDLDALQIKRILQLSARRDGFTGPEPSPEWGFGKVDALEALRLADALE